MSDEQPEPPTSTHTGFDEAVARFIQTDPRELAKKFPTTNRLLQRTGSKELTRKSSQTEGLKKMSCTPRPFKFSLNATEIAEMEAPSGQGGHQNLHARIRAELGNGPDVTFNDEEMGELIRYMTQYGSGGFQGRLRRAFLRSLCDQIGAKPV